MLVLTLVAALGSCSFQVPAGEPETEPVSMIDPPWHEGAPLVLVVTPGIDATAQLHRALVHELQPTFNVRTVRSEQLDVAGLAQALARHQPAAVVLVDNRSMTLYRNYQHSQPRDATLPPALVLMASFVADSVQSLRNASAISYEVPGVTGIVALRTVLEQPIRRVGVVYREPFERFVARNRELARVEDVELVGMQLPGSPTANELGQALHGLLASAQPVDALWVLNDNVLLTPALLRDVWLPVTHAFRRPVLVGVETLVSRKLDFGSLAVMPDLSALGLQAAQHLTELAARQWHAHSVVEPPVSVLTVVDAAQAAEFFSLREEALDEVDRVVR